MSTRSTIINAFKTEAEDKIQSSRGYETDPVEIRLGIYNFDYFAQRPAIGYWAYSDEKDDEYLDDNRHRLLHILVYGYADTDGLGNYDSIYQLADDVERFLMTEWSYTDCTLLGEAVITVGGTDNERCMFDLRFDVQYLQDF